MYLNASWVCSEVWKDLSKVASDLSIVECTNFNTELLQELCQKAGGQKSHQI